MQIFLLQRVSQERKCSDFLTLLKFKDKVSVTEKIISDGTEYASVQDLLSIYQIRPLLFL